MANKKHCTLECHDSVLNARCPEKRTLFWTAKQMKNILFRLGSHREVDCCTFGEKVMIEEIRFVSLSVDFYI